MKLIRLNLGYEYRDGLVIAALDLQACTDFTLALLSIVLTVAHVVGVSRKSGSLI